MYICQRVLIRQDLNWCDLAACIFKGDRDWIWRRLGGYTICIWNFKGVDEMTLVDDGR